MKKITRVSLGLVTAGLLTFGLIGVSQITANNKVKLHHGNKIISVSTNALNSHLNHGDLVHRGGGNCICVDGKLLIP